MKGLDMYAFSEINPSDLQGLISFSFKYQDSQQVYFLEITSSSLEVWKTYADNFQLEKSNFELFHNYMNQQFGYMQEYSKYQKNNQFLYHFTYDETNLNVSYHKPIKEHYKIIQGWKTFFENNDFHVKIHTPLKTCSPRVPIHEYLIFLNSYDMDTLTEIYHHTLSQDELAKLLFRLEFIDISAYQAQFRVNTLLKCGLNLEQINLAQRGDDRDLYHWFYDLVKCALITENNETDQGYSCPNLSMASNYYLKIATALIPYIKPSALILDDYCYIPSAPYGKRIGSYSFSQHWENHPVRQLLFCHYFFMINYHIGEMNETYTLFIEELFSKLCLPENELPEIMWQLLCHVIKDDRNNRFSEQQKVRLLKAIFKKPLKLDPVKHGQFSWKNIGLSQFGYGDSENLVLKELCRIYDVPYKENNFTIEDIDISFDSNQ